MMERPGCLLLLQIDHLSGEELGHLVETLYAWGAGSVQILPTVTKKNRPGHLALVDTGRADEKTLAQGLTRSFGITGYHRLETVHCCQPVASRSHPVVVRCGGEVLRADIPIKVVGDLGSPLAARVEYEGLRELNRLLDQRFGVGLPLRDLKTRIETLLAAGSPLELDLDPESGKML